jgi:hypothetical protein
MAKFTGEYPKNLNVQGVLSFPITSDADLAALKEWRDKKGIKKPKFADKIGGSLFITDKMAERIADHLETVYLPFVDVLYKETDGEKGVGPAQVKELLALVKKRDWSTKQLPLRELTPKDVENRPDDKYSLKLKFQGPYESDISKKAIVYDGNTPMITSLDSLDDENALPESRADYDELWWGAGWTFRANIRFNAFDTASLGVTGYAPTLFLLPHLGMPVSGGGDGAVLEEGDDWADD